MINGISLAENYSCRPQIVFSNVRVSHRISSGTTSPDRNLPLSYRISSALRARSFSNFPMKQQAPQSGVNSRCSLQRMSSWTSVRLICCSRRQSFVASSSSGFLSTLFSTDYRHQAVCITSCFLATELFFSILNLERRVAKARDPLPQQLEMRGGCSQTFDVLVVERDSPENRREKYTSGRERHLTEAAVDARLG